MNKQKILSKYSNKHISIPEINKFIVIQKASERTYIETYDNQFALLWVDAGVVSIEKECGFIYLCEKELLYIPPNNKYYITHISDNSDVFLLELDTLEFLNTKSQSGYLFGQTLNASTLIKTILKKDLCIYSKLDALFIASILQQFAVDLDVSPANLKLDILVADLNSLIYRIASLPDIGFNPLSDSFSTDNTIAWILKYVRENYNSVTITELASKLHYNPDYLSSYIYKKMDKTFSQLLCERRMVCSKTLIHDTNLSLKNIALQIGYKNYTSFYRAFVSYYKQSPNEYCSLFRK